jgi:hypothetical protein
LPIGGGSTVTIGAAGPRKRAPKVPPGEAIGDGRVAQYRPTEARNSLFPCSNSTNSLFSVTDFAVLANAFACSGGQGICAQRPGTTAQIGPGIAATAPHLENSLLFSLLRRLKLRRQCGRRAPRRPPRLVACRNRAYVTASAAATPRATIAQ